MASNLKDIAISSIRTNPVALRELNKDAEQYLNLIHSVRKNGVLSPVTVIEKVDPADNSTFYQLVDGLHRYSAACEVDLPTIPVNILSISESEAVATQVMANIIKIDTKPVQYTQALQRILSAEPLMTLDELAERVSQTTSFVKQRFSLLKLEPTIQAMVDASEITIVNAYALSKLPHAEQLELVDFAISQDQADFVKTVTDRKKQLAEQARTGKEAGPAKFEPVAKARKMVDLKNEHVNGTAGLAITAAENLTTAAEGFAAGIAWVLQLDKASVEEAEAKWNAQIKAREESKKKAAAIAAAKRQEEASAKAQAAREKAAGVLTDEELAAGVAEAKRKEAEAKAAKEAKAAEAAPAQ